MAKQRKLMCEYGPFFYWLSVRKENLKKDLADAKRHCRFAKAFDKENLPYVWSTDAKVLIRELHGVDMTLQYNKVTNLTIAAKALDGIVIQPGEEFSLWKLVGDTTKRKGYLPGLIITGTSMKAGVGGGMCQMANLIHWLVLHSPLAITERHHHSDALFPDVNRKSPFGTGTSICYKSQDYRFKSTTDTPVQLRIWLDETNLNGELRSTAPIDTAYRLFEEDHHYAKEADGVFYRNSKVYRTIYDKATGEQLKKELILCNHSQVMYDYALIPAEEIREHEEVIDNA